jgi:hypothetical protein
MNSVTLLAFALIVPVVFGAGYMKGASDTRLDMTVETQQMLLAQNAKIAEQERKMEQERKELDEYYTKELFNAQQNVDDAVSSINNGTKRLYVRTVKTTCPVSDTAASTSVDNAAGRAELDPDTSTRILRLTERGDKAIIKLTACQAYIRDVCAATGAE